MKLFEMLLALFFPITFPIVGPLQGLKMRRKAYLRELDTEGLSSDFIWSGILGGIGLSVNLYSFYLAAFTRVPSNELMMRYLLVMAVAWVVTYLSARHYTATQEKWEKILEEERVAQLSGTSRLIKPQD